MAGTTNFDTIKSNGKTVPVNMLVQFRQSTGETLTDAAFFIAMRACKVVAIRQVHSVAGSDGSAVNLQVTKDTATDAPGAGTNLLTNNSDAGFNLKGTANTVQTGTLAASAATLTLAAGNRLSIDVAGTPTAVANCVVEVELELA